MKIQTTTFIPVQRKPKDRLVRERECRAITGLARQRRWELEKQGKFPKRVHLGTRSVAWRLSDLEKWIDEVSENGLL